MGHHGSRGMGCLGPLDDVLTVSKNAPVAQVRVIAARLHASAQESDRRVDSDG